MSNEQAMWHLSLHFSRNSITSSHLCTRNGSFIFNRCKCFFENNATLFHHVPFSETVILSGTSTLCILALKNISRLISLLFFIDLTKPSRLSFLHNSLAQVFTFCREMFSRKVKADKMPCSALCCSPPSDREPTCPSFSLSNISEPVSVVHKNSKAGDDTRVKNSPIVG